MKLGIVDLGTNSLRFDIYQISSKGKPTLLHREKEMIRLGAEVFTKRRLSKIQKARVLRGFTRVARVAKQHSIDRMVCYGTSALRAAKDTPHLLKAIHVKTGCRVQVISGNREAALIAKGVMKYNPCKKRTLLIDIGGGSSELTGCLNNKISFSTSIRQGSMRIQSLYLEKHPPSSKAIAHAQQAVQRTLKQKLGTKNRPPFQQTIGSAGTIKALCKVTRSKHHTIHLKDLERFFEKVRLLKINRLKGLLKTEGRRGDIILAGTLLLIEILKFFKLKKILVTQRGLRDGILLEQIGHGKI